MIKQVLSVLRYLLMPFSWLYHAVTALRNHLFAIGYKKATAFQVPVICVGNLAAGGSGKTPMVAYLLHAFQDKYPLAMLSRGYRRKTMGFRLAGNDDSAHTVGDEPFQLYRQFADKVVIAVGEDRSLAIPSILYHHEQVKGIVMDDGFQHLAVTPRLSLLLSDYHHPFYADHLLPYGRLRESRQGASRAHAIVMTRCPEGLSASEVKAVRHKVSLYSSAPLFFTNLAYESLVPFHKLARPLASKVVLVSGIASPEAFHGYGKNNFTVVRTFAFGDHHAYTASEVDNIEKEAAALGADVITTEKDYVKLCVLRPEPVSEKVNWFYLPIRLAFLHGEDEFLQMIETTLR